MKMGNRIALIIAVILTLSASLPAIAVERNIEKSFDVIPGGTLKLDTDIGTVEISSHPDNTVQVQATLVAHTSSDSRAEDIFDNYKLTFDSSKSDVIIKGDFVDNWLWRNNRLSVKFTITVPERYNISVATSGGNIDVGDIKGQVNLKTSGGRINLGNINGVIDARTSGGGIKVEDVTGNTRVYTSGGNIRIGTVKGDLDARTSGGGIDVDGVEGNLVARTSGGSLHLLNVSGELSGDTSGGPIVAELMKQVTGRLELRTSGGSIKLSVPADFRADLNASTSGGHVYTDVPISVQGKISNSSLSGKINGGGPEVVLRTSGGSIEITTNVH